jgi:Kef-type K+ transport system membrane component KefB
VAADCGRIAAGPMRRSAGVIPREVLRARELAAVDSKLTAIGFGVLVPFFFVVSGMSLDINSFGNATGRARTALFLLVMLVVRGVPALLLYRPEFDKRTRRAVALMNSTQLSLVLGITAVATSTDHMSPAIAAPSRRGRALDAVLPAAGASPTPEPAGAAAVRTGLTDVVVAMVDTVRPPNVVPGAVARHRILREIALKQPHRVHAEAARLHGPGQVRENLGRRRRGTVRDMVAVVTELAAEDHPDRLAPTRSDPGVGDR